MRRFSMQEAKNKLSQVIDDALAGEPQVITRRGEEVVIVLAYPEYQRLTGTDESLYEFFRRSPLVGIGLDLSRDEDEIPDRFAP